MPFAIEARTPRNQDISIQCLDRLRLRGAVRASVEVFDNQRSEEEWDEDEEEGKATRPVSAKIIDGVGELPGMLLHVNPATGEWRMVDPLYKKENALERIRKAMKRVSGMNVVDQRLKGMKPRSGKVDEHRMKTLCRELLCFIEADEARVVKGLKPSREDIDELPGRYLLNWSDLGKWRQPKFEDQYDEWERDVNKLTQMDG